MARKKGINGREKGAKFERTTAKDVSEWWDGDFHRTPGSGGLHWKKDNRVTGDITPGEKESKTFPFSIECKKVEDWNFEQIIKGVGIVPDWWSQCVRDAESVGKIPLLIFTKNRSPVFYMMPMKDWRTIGVPFHNVFLASIKRNVGMAYKRDRVAIGHFDDLMAIPKETIIKNLKNGKGSVKNGGKK